MLEDGDARAVPVALRTVAESVGGMTALARKTGLSRETLYRTLSKRGNPRLDTLAAILAAFGLRLTVGPKADVPQEAERLWRMPEFGFLKALRLVERGADPLYARFYAQRPSWPPRIVGRQPVRAPLATLVPQTRRKRGRTDIGRRGPPETWYQLHRHGDRRPVRKLDPQCVLPSAVHDAGGPRLSVLCTVPGAGCPSQIQTQRLLCPVRRQDEPISLRSRSR